MGHCLSLQLNFKWTANPWFKGDQQLNVCTTCAALSGQEEEWRAAQELCDALMLAFSHSSFLGLGEAYFPVPCPPSGGEFQRAVRSKKTFTASCTGRKLEAGVTCTTEWSRFMSRDHSQLDHHCDGTASVNLQRDRFVLWSGRGEHEQSIHEMKVFHFKSDLLLVFHRVGLMLTEPLPTYSLLGIFFKCQDLNKVEIWGASLYVRREGGGDIHFETVLK